MKIYAIRHTSVDIESGICYGQSDLCLRSSFNEERKKTADQIQGISLDKVFSSPLKRCKILAENLFPGEKLLFDDRLKELNFGDWELKTWDDIYFEPEGKVWMDNYQTLPTKNGESYPEMEKRVADFLNEIKQNEAGNVAIVTHAGVVRIFKHLIEDMTTAELFESFKPAYGSVTEFII